MTLPPPISVHERRARIERLAESLDRDGTGAVLIGSQSGLRYFAGLRWTPTERLVALLVRSDGRIAYIAPRFEEGKIAAAAQVEADILCWEEHESPFRLVAAAMPEGRLDIDPLMPVWVWHGLAGVMGADRLADGSARLQALRARKSPAELALLSHAKAITLEVQRRAHGQLQAGLCASELASYIDAQHRALGGEGGSFFCAVSFGPDTSLPHGGETDRVLSEGDVVLVDTGTMVDGYKSDITRTYVFGEPDADMRRVWEHEKAAQAVAFQAARPGRPCEAVDDAVRTFLTSLGYGPDYRLPGLPHRTGHGIGLDIHEGPYLVRGDKTPLQTGMCFSNEPMIVMPGRFGVRLEDHFYMGQDGPVWFTEPSHSLDDPFRGVEPITDPR
ncbi:MAG: M24 family metallopeptidase [Caulobacterales bacterium]|uniref:M24 family metallopeptidase n=1 Tax=Glycocaulis sp. TaxID=1969725 RepID=UPI003F9F0D43